MKIAIDGPAGAGKSTVAKRIARQLRFTYIDTGAMYRALTWNAMQKGIDLNDTQALTALAHSIDIQFQFTPEQQRVICNGYDVTSVIRSPEVSAAVSIVAAQTQVREVMVKAQQQMAQHLDVVVDGRDIGERVLPDADFKFFLTASLEERVARRQLDLINQGYQVDIESIRQDIIQRDRMDMERETGALKILPDSIVIDTTGLSIEEVCAQILTIIEEGGHAI